ncbi:MAG TPA: hypothetical protein PLL53_05070 [Saprospiraceae bacterium]|nr:hypothetical protein [Saprospiraceae bacterium]
MKTILLLAGLLLVNISFAGIVPEYIQRAFEKDHPEAESAFWEITKEGYAATFQAEEGLKKAIYSEEGGWLETRTRILLRDIPADVQREIRKEIGYTKATYIGKVLSPEGRFYRIESETAEAVVVRIFDENGRLISENEFAFSTNSKA